MRSWDEILRNIDRMLAEEEAELGRRMSIVERRLTGWLIQQQVIHNEKMGEDK